jgi:Salmonella virulence plasmid 65kDa B protein
VATLGAETLVVRRYRPRLDTAFERTERWPRVHDGDAHWRPISRDGVTSVFREGRGLAHRRCERLTAVYSWLASEIFDDRGNAMSVEQLRRPLKRNTKLDSSCTSSEPAPSGGPWTGSCATIFVPQPLLL